jgi:hypothetical protein
MAAAADRDAVGMEAPERLAGVLDDRQAEAPPSAGTSAG